ncbi:GNVR domain-containing protein [Parabacteroides sp. Marseille-P3160]|uniref:GumC family protein n=1 Tax=Parabacteroides sp. Marseille-P3160 TaxID=1917887 RepID=UPI0009BBF244|nr:GNVR domain-containing protein [Parabacteroides sp. Marseille-P3160]
MENAEVKESSINLFKELKNAFGYWNWFLISIVICVLISVLYINVTQPVYQVDANLLIKNESDKGGSGAMSSMLKGFSFGSSLNVGSASVDDELLLINSYTLIRKTVAELGLNVAYTSGNLFTKKDYYNNSPFIIKSKENLAETFNSAISFKLKTEKDGTVHVKAKDGWWSTVGKVSGKTFPLILSTTEYGDFIIDKTEYFSKRPIESMDIVFLGYDLTAEIYSKNIEISIKEKKANGINLSIEETNVQRGKDLLNTMVKIYNEEGIEDKNTSAQRSVEFFDQRIAINQEELNDIEKRLEEFKIANNLTDIETEAEIMLTKNGDFKEKLIDSEIQYATVGLIEDFLKDPKNKYALAPFNMGVIEKTASEGLQQYNNFLLERYRLLQTTTEDNPNVQLLNKQIEIMRQNVLETFKSIKSGFNFARIDLKKQESEFVSRIKKMPTQEREFLDIKRQQTIKSELYLFLLQQKEEAAMKLATSMEKAKIIDSAYSLSKPVKPNKLFIFSIAILLALAIPTVILTVKRLLQDL